jgi:hypothetical protein
MKDLFHCPPLVYSETEAGMNPALHIKSYEEK